MTRALLAVFLLLIGAAPARADSITVDGRRYDYLVFAPAVRSEIIVAFHGFLGSGPVARDQMKLHLQGAPAVVVYPSGWWLTWDSRPNSIDVHFAGALIAKLRQQFGALPVCVTGISAGGSMAWRAAVEVAAVDRLVAVAGPLNPATASPLHLPIVLQLQGDADTIVPLEGNATIPAAHLGIDLIVALGGQAELRVIPGGIHAWDFGIGYPTATAVLAGCGL